MQNSKNVFAFAPNRATGAHYIDFVAETYGATSETNIADGSASEKVPLTVSERKLIYRFLRTADRTGKIDNQVIRLVIEESPGYERMVVDQEGVVLANGKAHQLSPLNFLIISRFLESIASKSAKARKIRRPNDFS